MLSGYTTSRSLARVVSGNKQMESCMRAIGCAISLLAVGCTLAACRPDKQASAREVRARTSSIVRQTATATAASMTAIAENPRWQETMARIEASLNNGSAALSSNVSVPVQLPVAGAAMPQQTPSVYSDADIDAEFATDQSMEATDDVYETVSNTEESAEVDGPDAEQLAQTAIGWLNRYVFAEENVESIDGDVTVFKVKGATVCSETICGPVDADATSTSGDADYSCVETLNRECVAFVDSVGIRVRTTLVDEDGLNVDLIIGGENNTPMSFELRPARVAIDIDMKASYSAYLTARNYAGEEAFADAQFLPKVMTGRLHAEIITHDEHYVTFYTSIPEDLVVEGSFPDGSDFAMRAAAATPLFGVNLDGTTGSVTAALSANSFDLTAPIFEENESGDTITKTIEVHLDGASFGVELGGDKIAGVVGGSTTEESATPQTVRITNVGLGVAPSTVKVDGVTIFAISVNEGSGHKFNLTISPDAATGTAAFSYAPELDVNVLFQLGALASNPADANEVALDGTYRIRLAGPGVTVVAVPGDASGSKAGLRVTDGSLSLHNTKDAEPLVVAAGQCLMTLEEPSAQFSGALSYFAAGTCGGSTR